MAHEVGLWHTSTKRKPHPPDHLLHLRGEKKKHWPVCFRCIQPQKISLSAKHVNAFILLQGKIRNISIFKYMY